MPAKRKTGKPQERDREELSEIESQDEDQEEMNSTICNRNDEPEIIEDTRVEYRPIAESREAGNAPILTENFEFNRTSNQGIPRPGMRDSLAACGDNTDLNTGRPAIREDISQKRRYFEETERQQQIEAEGPEILHINRNPELERFRRPLSINPRNDGYRDERIQMPHLRREQNIPEYMHAAPRTHEQNEYQDEPDLQRIAREPRCKTPQERFSVSAANIKIPAFTGKDDWKVWINRFEAIAERRDWTDEEKLDELLPRIQGEAGEFVFTQLPKDALRDYTELVRELGYRYRVIENQKSFIATFSSRNKKPGERIEAYAAELKRLHYKAYPKRSKEQRKEELLERFMRGILDEEVRFFVNYMKTPEDIDEAVYAVVECMSERQTSKYREPYNDRKMKKYVRRASPFNEEDYEGDSERDTDDDTERKGLQLRSSQKHNQKQTNKDTTPGEKDSKDRKVPNEMKTTSQSTNDDETKTLIQQLQERIQILEKQSQENNRKTEEKRKTIVCYNCNKPGHTSRQCRTPKNGNRNQEYGYASYTNTQKQNQRSRNLNYTGQPRVANREPTF